MNHNCNIQFLENILTEMRQESCQAHRDIYTKLDQLGEKVYALNIWKSKVIGMVLALSTLVSASAWAITTFVVR